MLQWCHPLFAYSKQIRVTLDLEKYSTSGEKRKVCTPSMALECRFVCPTFEECQKRNFSNKITRILVRANHRAPCHLAIASFITRTRYTRNSLHSSHSAVTRTHIRKNTHTTHHSNEPANIHPRSPSPQRSPPPSTHPPTSRDPSCSPPRIPRSDRPSNTVP